MINTSIEGILNMPFLTFSYTNILFVEQNLFENYTYQPRLY